MAGSPYGTLACSEKTYKTVTISSASSSITLMAENLNIGTRFDGWATVAPNIAIEKYCYEDSESNCATDGGLYQWDEAMGLEFTCNDVSCASEISTGHHRGICPVGWHIPKPVEWNTLAIMLGGSSVAGKKMKLNTTGNTSWDASASNDGNSSGFSALPAGIRYRGSGFGKSGYYAGFWEASEDKDNAADAYFRALNDGFTDLRENLSYKSYGYSVRCFKD